MSKFKDLSDVCWYLDMPSSETTGKQLISAIKDLATDDRVYARDDDYLGITIPDDLSNKTIDEIDDIIDELDQNSYQDIQYIIEKAEDLEEYLNTPLSEEEQEEIDEQRDTWVRDRLRALENSD